MIAGREENQKSSVGKKKERERGGSECEEPVNWNEQLSICCSQK